MNAKQAFVIDGSTRCPTSGETNGIKKVKKERSETQYMREKRIHAWMKREWV